MEVVDGRPGEHTSSVIWCLLAALGWGQDEFEPVREVHDCQISMRPPEHPEGAAMRAECRWPEVDYQRAVDKLARFDAYDDYIWPIAESRIERSDEDGRLLLYQRQHIWPLSDREVLLWMDQESYEGGLRFVWTTANDEPLDLAEDAIRTPKNEGYWLVAPSEEGGVRVVHEIAVVGGGTIPAWVVNMVRVRGFARVMGDVRAIVAAD